MDNVNESDVQPNDQPKTTNGPAPDEILRDLRPVYEAKIEPLVEQIKVICEAEGIPFITVFQTSFCTSGSHVSCESFTSPDMAPTLAAMFDFLADRSRGVDPMMEILSSIFGGRVMVIGGDAQPETGTMPTEPRNFA